MNHYNTIRAAWAKAQGGKPDEFHAAFERASGIPEAVVAEHFAAWNLLPRAEVEFIAERHGTTITDGGFQAYLAEVTDPVIDGERMSVLAFDANEALMFIVDNQLACNALAEREIVKVCQPDFICEDYDGDLPYLSILNGTFLLIPFPTTEVVGIAKREVARTKWQVHVTVGGPTHDDPFQSPDIEVLKPQDGTFGEAVSMVAAMWATDLVGNILSNAAEARAFAQVETHA
jgi:hypothetical protein